MTPIVIWRRVSEADATPTLPKLPHLILILLLSLSLWAAIWAAVASLVS